MSETRQVNLRLPEDVRRWLRHEAAERETMPGAVVADLVRAEQQRRWANSAERLTEEGR